jgi:hypothetical protein
MEKVTPILQQLWQLLIRYTKKLATWWKTTFQSKSSSGKIILGGASLLIACCLFFCLCSIPISLLTPSPAETPEQIQDEIDEATPSATLMPTEPLATDTPEPSDTPIPPTDTPLPPTDTPAPTNTPKPLNTPRPTNTPEPTVTLTPVPVVVTNTPLPTSPPAQPTQPPAQPTQPAQPTATQPPVTVGAQIAIVAVDKRAEYVDLRNTGDQPQDLSGWVLISEKGNQSCSLGGIINPGETLRVWALAADAGQGGYNCGFGQNIWNNSEPDPAVLYNNQGAQVSRYP